MAAQDALTLAIVALFGASMVCGFLAVVGFIRAGWWPQAGRRGPARLELLLGLDLPEDAQRHVRRAWTLTALFLALWAAATVLTALAVPALR